MVRLPCMLLFILGAFYGSPMFIIADPTNCPLDFTILDRVDMGFNWSQVECKLTVNALELVLEDYFRRTGLFLPPVMSIEHCLSALQQYFHDIDIRSQCGASYRWVIGEECMSIHTREDFELVVPESIRMDLSHMCHMVKNLSSCALCHSVISDIQRRYLHGNHSCVEYVKIFVMAISTPVDQDTIQCLLSLHVEHILPPRDKVGVLLAASIIGGFLYSLIVVGVIRIGVSRYKKKQTRQRELELVHSPTGTEGHIEALGTTGQGVTLEHTLQAAKQGEPNGDALAP